MERKKGLGKGLSALIPEKLGVGSEKYKEIEVMRISLNPLQPREDFSSQELTQLKNSIAREGLLQPILVVKESSGYRLIAGERRLRAVKELQWEKIPAVVLEEAQEVELLKKSLIENVQRANLNPLEEALGYRKLMKEYGYSLEQIAQEVGKNIATISNTVRLLNLPPEIQKDLKEGLLTPGHARALLMLEKEEEIVKLAEEIKRKKISVREAERKVKKVKGKFVDPNLEAIKDKLQKKLGTKVELQMKKKGGKIEIFYFDEKDLARILKILFLEEL